MIGNTAEYKLVSAEEIQAALQTAMYVGAHTADSIAALAEQQKKRPQYYEKALAYAERVRAHAIYVCLHNMGFPVTWEEPQMDSQWCHQRRMKKYRN